MIYEYYEVYKYYAHAVHRCCLLFTVLITRYEADLHFMHYMDRSLFFLLSFNSFVLWVKNVCDDRVALANLANSRAQLCSTA